MNVEVVDDVAERGAEFVAAQLRAKPASVLALPAGRTAKRLYEVLVRRADEISFRDAMAFALDEVLDGTESFQRQLRDEFYDRVGMTRTFAPDGETEARIAGAGGLDLAILGTGVNGHIAFNEPGSPMDSRTRVVTLSDGARKAITMGVATILAARRILLLASGESKADAVARAIQGPVSEACPASALQRHPDVTFVLDPQCVKLEKCDV